MEKPLRIAVVDDDPQYCNLLAAAARGEGVAVHCYDSLLDVEPRGSLGAYDLAIIDFDLNEVNGVEIADYLGAVFGDIPMLLISGQERHPEPGRPWPASIRAFVGKEKGPRAIVAAARGAAAPAVTAGR